MVQPRKTAIELTPPTEPDEASPVTKHRRVFAYLHASIQSGKLTPGDRLPSEAELGRLFAASRITVAKAVADLQRMGLVTRRPGAGTHVKAVQPASGRTFGLLIPELGLTEIFEPICHGIMRCTFSSSDALLWGHSSTSVQESAREAQIMVQSLISQKVTGVFFAPLVMSPDKDAANRRIAKALERAQIPVVLLDRGYLPFPERSEHDLVGIDNRQAGFLATDHLLKLGAQRLAFFSGEHNASTVEARITGFYEALRHRGVVPDRDAVLWGSAQDTAIVRRMFDELRPDAIVCTNDLTAAQLMQSLMGLGVRIPEEVRIVGIDDVKYASLLPVPLTTVHQDCAGIGMAAMSTMLSRLDHPELPVRDVLLPTRLVIRRSCGAYLQKPAQPDLIPSN
jgi:DNA-binding LacI/PurR family transcriptional regulator